MERKALSALVVLALCLSGCTSIFFQPSRTRYPYLELDKLSAKSVELRSKDQTKLAAWVISSVDARRNHPEIVRVENLKPNETRGVALQFHGNAENMTSHYRFQLWLLFEGWDVLTFDYRGYGSSQGDPSDLNGVRDDGVAAIEWANRYAKERNLPLAVFGQSLGASIAISALTKTQPEQMKILIVDSAFYSFRSIAREKLSSVWFLWPFQWLGWLLVSNELSAAKGLNSTPPERLGAFATPAVFLHSENDPVVPNRQGERLYEIYPGEKLRWTTKEPGHVNTLNAEVFGENPPKAFHRENLKKKLSAIQGTHLKESTAPTSK